MAIVTNKPTVIFDFDGTLVDSIVASIRIFEKIMKRPEPYSDEQIARLRGLSALQVVRELRIRPWRVPWMVIRGRQLMRRQIDNIVVFEGIEDVLRQLKAAGIPMYIMSSNSPGNIRQLMKARGLDHYFTHVYGNVGIFGKAKRLRQIIERNRLDMARVIYVGDEGRDVEAAKHVGIKSVAVGWGFNSPELLARHHPTELAESTSQLATILLSFSKIDKE
jgi:phosphoglycolate phosphatase